MARVLKRGDIHWAVLSDTVGREQAGRRPVLVLSNDLFNRKSGTVIAAAITSAPQRAGYPLTLKIASAELPKESWVKMGQIRTLSTKRLKRKIATVSPEEMTQIVEGLIEIIER